MSLGVNGDSLSLYLDYIAREDAAYVTGACGGAIYLCLKLNLGRPFLPRSTPFHCIPPGNNYLELYYQGDTRKAAEAAAGDALVTAR